MPVRPIPQILQIDWFWLLLAEILEQFLLYKFHIENYGLLDVILIWSFLQAGWLWRVDARSKAIYWYGATAVLSLIVYIFARFSLLPEAVDTSIGIADTVLSIASIFIFRRDMVRYFNTIDNVGLALTWPMTLLFSVLYFQYHFHDIAAYKLRNPEISTPAAT